MIQYLRRRRTLWSALAVGILAVPAVLGGSMAAPAESQDPVPQPELNPLAELPPDWADLEPAQVELLQSLKQLLDDLAPDEYLKHVVIAAGRHQIDARLIAAVITVESRWDAAAIGSYGEQGLMQILPSTGEWLARAMQLEQYDLGDPATNVEMGTFYLAALVREYGSVERALAVYNGGPRAAENWESNPYKQKVMTIYRQYVALSTGGPDLTPGQGRLLPAPARAA